MCKGEAPFQLFPSFFSLSPDETRKAKRRSASNSLSTLPHSVFGGAVASGSSKQGRSRITEMGLATSAGLPAWQCEKAV